jgi:hypothetical protein
VVGLTVPVPSWLWSGVQQLPQPCAHALPTSRCTAVDEIGQLSRKGPAASGMLSGATTPAIRLRGLPCDPSVLDRGWSGPNVRRGDVE